ncbi:MAG: HIT family hydrolase [bacterium]|nr:HIT family hydrolase [bacterium]
MENYQPNCLGCSIQNGNFKVSGGFLFSGKYFNVIQYPCVPIPGFLVVNAKRHIISIAQFTPAEIKEFTHTVYIARKAMIETLNISTVYLIQEERSCHFHMWLFPEYEWMNKYKPGISSLRKIMHYATVHLTTKSDKNNITWGIRRLKRYFKENKEL